MSQKKIKTGTLYRKIDLDRKQIDQEKRTVPLSFSSELVVERFFGDEILDHSEESVRLDRIKGRGSFLVNHDIDDQIGVVEDVRISTDRVGRALVRFGKSPRAEEIFQDVIDGIRGNISVGYRVHEFRLESEKDGKPTFRAMDWEPLEISLVSVPGDPSVGIMRADDSNFHTRIFEEEKKMDEPIKKTEEIPAPSPAPVVNLEEVRKEARDKESYRVREIMAYGNSQNMNSEASEAVSSGTTVDEFRKMIIDKRFNDKPVDTNPNIGLTVKEKQEFSMIRAIRSIASRGSLVDAPFEQEVSDAVSKKTGKQTRGFLVPFDVMTHETRDLLTGTPTAGGNLVSTDLMSGSFVDLLRNRMLLRAMGATVISGLVGDVAIPSQTGAASHFWVGENVAVTESEPTFGQLSMTPKTVGTFTDLSRKLILQSSSDVEALVRSDLATVLALAIDAAGINGTGAGGQPTGILNAAGIGSVAGGTNGLAPAWSHVVDLWKAVASANAAFGTLGFMTTTNVAGKLAVTEKATNTAQFIMPSLPGADGLASLAGFRAGISEQVPSNLTKGSGTNLSAIIFGNFADLIIGEWGALDILVDPFTGGAAGTTRIRVLQDVDILVRRVASFAAMKDAITV